MAQQGLSTMRFTKSELIKESEALDPCARSASLGTKAGPQTLGQSWRPLSARIGEKRLRVWGAGQTVSTEAGGGATETGWGRRRGRMWLSL